MWTSVVSNGLWSSRGQTSLRSKWIPLPCRSPIITIKLFILTTLNVGVIELRAIETISSFPNIGMHSIVWKVSHTEVTSVLRFAFCKNTLGFYRLYVKKNVRWIDALRFRHQECLSEVALCEALFNFSGLDIFRVYSCISISQWSSAIPSNF